MAKITKEKVIDTALELYSVKGFEATSMSDLAQALGIKAPTLYFHYKNKQALFDTIVETMRNYFWQAYPEIHLQIGSMKDAAKLYAENFDVAKQAAVKTFLFYYNDRYAGTFRRLVSIERYKNTQMDQVYRELYIDAPIDNQTELIEEMIKQGYILNNVAPRTVAYELYSPLFFLICQYDCMPKCESEAIKTVESHVQHFLEKYIIAKG